MTAKFAPTDQQRRTVRAMAAYGVPQDDIARVIDVAPKTLRLHFRDELDRAVIEANAKVAQTCYQMAISGQHPAATFFWLKTRAGWRETDRLEHTGANGQPVAIDFRWADALPAAAPAAAAAKPEPPVIEAEAADDAPITVNWAAD
ncbi:MAG: hypothetical protein JOZ05_25670 [Acetobacteraceae bacterium]|nr:hypothetical protein [Acetobacteraceae bacterium]